MSESFAELFEASLKSGQSMQSGTIVNAKVLEVKTDVVIVDAGLKSEGVIPIKELTNIPGTNPRDIVAEGDEIETSYWLVDSQADPELQFETSELEGAIQRSLNKLPSIYRLMLERFFDQPGSRG